MAREVKLGKLGDLALSFVPSAVLGVIAVWIILTLVAIGPLHVTLFKAIIGALAAVIVHWACDTAHQLGHAWAAHRVGHPMVGIRFWGVFSASVYPPDEPALPARVHIRRALGGPALSAVITLFAALLFVLVPSRGVLWLVALFFLLDNLLVFTLGSFLPLGFTDGSTLLHWMRAGDKATPLSS